MGWISINERLPKIGETVLFYQTWPEGTMFNCRAEPLKRTHIAMGGLRFGGEWVYYPYQLSNIIAKHVSHWMPLPDVPKNDI